MKKKCLAIGIILLFVGIAIIPSSSGTIEKQSSPTSRGHWLYVGGSGPGNYTRVQDAINDTNDGDTVYIFHDSSPYYEKLVINTSIALIGEDRHSTIINGTGPNNYVIEATVHNVVISEVTVEHNPGSGGMKAEECRICNTTIRNCDTGIIAMGQDIIDNNEIYNCTTYGISGTTNSNIIRQNTISNCGWCGIIFYIGSHNVIEQNIITHNGDGIGFLYPYNNRISNNVITSNRWNGVMDSVYHSGNTYSNNTITDNEECGLYIRGDTATVINNSIRFNHEYGVLVDLSNSCIYHNNFIGNTINAYDKGSSNSWDNGYPSGGNFWDDYNGTDENGDGIGDSPYLIPGGTNKDRYPLMHPLNKPPHPPTITGPASGNAKTTYTYTFTTMDPDGDNVSYFVDWGDNTASGWLGPYPSDVEQSASHSWSKKGTYTIRIKAKDTWGAESDWGTLGVHMPLSYEPPHSRFFEWLFERFPNAFPILRYLLGYEKPPIN